MCTALLHRYGRGSLKYLSQVGEPHPSVMCDGCFQNIQDHPEQSRQFLSHPDPSVQNVLDAQSRSFQTQCWDCTQFTPTLPPRPNTDTSQCRPSILLPALNLSAVSGLVRMSATCSSEGQYSNVTSPLAARSLAK